MDCVQWLSANHATLQFMEIHYTVAPMKETYANYITWSFSKHTKASCVSWYSILYLLNEPKKSKLKKLLQTKEWQEILMLRQAAKIINSRMLQGS